MQIVGNNLGDTEQFEQWQSQALMKRHKERCVHTDCNCINPQEKVINDCDLSLKCPVQE